MSVQTITLSGYSAQTATGGPLRLGTWDSYGIEQLQIVPGPEWEGLTITATFVTSTGSTRMVVPTSGLVDVPPEATAQALNIGTPGAIVFAGVSDGVQRISTNAYYVVSNHAPVEGSDPQPTPDEWAQFVAMVQQYAQQASQSATEAEGSATQAAQYEKNAAASAGAAAESATDAAAELEKVQGAGSAALQAIGSAQSTAVDAVQAAQQTGVDAVQGAQNTATQAIEQARQNAVQAVGQASTTQVGAVNAAGQAQQTAIQQAAQTAVDDVQQAQETSVQAVQNAQTEAEEAITALVPTVYTKAESDARYAPIEAAIKVSGTGTGLVSLSPTVAWGMQGLKLYGRSWQDGTPSVETEVPIEDAGQDGQIDMTVCGENLANIPDYGSQKMSISHGVVILNGEFESSTGGRLNFVKLENPLFLAKGKYFFKLYTSKSVSECQMQAQFLEAQDIYSNGITTGWYGGGSVSVGGESVINVSEDSVFNYFNLDIISGAFDNDTVKLMLNVGGTAQPYQSYTAQQLPLPTPDGLPGIPVDSGGTWTDENGQQWVSDVLDLAAGTKTQNCALEVLTGTPNFTETDDVAGRYWWRSCLKNTYKAGTFNALSNFGQFQSWGNPVSGKDIFAISQNHVYFSPSTAMTAEEMNAKFAELIASDSPPVILGQLATPITTPLDAAVIAAYKALTTYPGTTNVLAPDAGIEASALAEPNQYIEDRIQAAITQAVTQAVTLTGGNA